MTRKTSSKGIAIIKKWEGLRLTAYLCPANVWTIGYGHTGGVYKGMTITAAQAEALLEEDLAKYERNVNSFDSKMKWNQNEFDAMVSFALNLGSINQLVTGSTSGTVNSACRSKATIAEKMLLYVNGGGVKLPGLVNRRKEERALFLSTSLDTGSVSNNTTEETSSGNASIINSTEYNGATNVKGVQQYLNGKYSYKIAVDNIYGANTKKALVKALQMELNKQFNANLAIDGIFGSKSYNACVTVKKNAKGNLTAVVQAMLICHGLAVGTYGLDGSYGNSTESAVKRAQINKKLSSDGICGKNTFRAYMA